MSFQLNLVSRTIFATTVLLGSMSAYAMQAKTGNLQDSKPSPNKMSSSTPASQTAMSSSTPASQTTMSSSSASVKAGALMEAKSPNTTTSKK